MDINISLQDFFTTIYPDVPEGETVCLARPTDTGIPVYPVTERKLKQIARKPGTWYGCVSTVVTAERLRRRKSDCRAAYLLMLDDIGDPEKVANIPSVEPSIKLETSEGNFQYLYLIDPYEFAGDAEILFYEACIRACIKAGYCDEGATDICRLFRLPGSVNTKEGKDKWQTRVTDWSPDRVWPLDTLMTELGLEPIYIEKGVYAADYDGEIPTDIEDTAALWLAENGRLGKSNDGWYDTRCPWAAEHTDGSDTSGYSPLGEGDQPLMRGWNCFHSHCQGRTIKDFLGWMTEQSGPSVPVSGASLFRAVETRQHIQCLNKMERYKLLRDVLESEYGVAVYDLHDRKMSKTGPKSNQPTTLANVICILERLGVKARYNMQTHLPDLFFNNESVQEIVESIEGSTASAKDNAIEDSSHTTIRHAIIDTAISLDMSQELAVHRGINDIAGFDKYHPADQLMFSEKWDGFDRIEELSNTVTLARVDDRDMFTKMLRLWLLQVPQGVYGWNDPKAIPYVLVLASPEHGTGKTTWFERLVTHRSLFKRAVTLSMSKGNVVDTVRQATGTVISELGELETTFSKSADGDLKNFLSNTCDEYRVPYGTNSVKQARSTVFCGTVNHLEFINEKEDRRFWPFEITMCDIYHDVDMGQVWAQIKHIYDTEQVGRSIHQENIWEPTLETREHMKDKAGRFRSLSHVEELLKDYFEQYEGAGEPVTVSDISERLMVGNDPRTRTSITEFMRSKLGPYKNRMKDATGKIRYRVWEWPTTAKHKNPALKIIK